MERGLGRKLRFRAIMVAYNDGIVHGCSDTEFASDDELLRGEAVKNITRFVVLSVL